MLEPLDDIRKSLMVDGSTRRLITELAGLGSTKEHFKDVLEQTSGIRSAAHTLVQQIEDSRAHTKRLFGDLGVGSGIQNYLKDFERINKQWRVPGEVLGLVDSFKVLQEELGKVALPTIDWGSAGALAKLLGKEGLEEQLAHLGIQPDGSLHESAELPEKGILSRKQSDALALLSLLLGILFFLYQEMSSRQDKASTEAYQTQTTAKLESHFQQIQSLTGLIESALVVAAKAPEERFVVRARMAMIRSKPAHGAAVQGKLLPNEVVRAIDKDGKWIEVEYYHWLHEDYRTGWVMKKYLERVPASYAKAVTGQP